MAKLNFDDFITRIKNLWQDKLGQGSDEEGYAYARREKIVVFIISFVIALSLWLMVNLSRDFNLNLNLPIELGNIPGNEALARELPEYATVSVKGEGWKLISVYNNPPQIFVDVTEGEVNLYDQVREQMNAVPDVSVLKVQPLILNPDLEPRITKTVPVESQVEVGFRNQYDFVGSPQLTPDSVTISGARSQIADVQSWPTQPVKLEEVRDDIDQVVPLKSAGDLVRLSQPSVQLHARISEYTEGEVRVYLRTHDLPPGRSVTYNPSIITIKYDVPIEEYKQAQELTPFEAYVPYAEIERDSTGFVSPTIEPTGGKLHIKLRSYQPQKVSYYNVVDQ